MIGLQLYVDGFNVLTKSRNVGQGYIGPIPYSEISCYCDDEGFEGEDREDFIYLLEALDAAYIKWQNKHFSKKMEAEAHKAKSQSRAPRKR